MRVEDFVKSIPFPSIEKVVDHLKCAFSFLFISHVAFLLLAVLLVSYRYRIFIDLKGGSELIQKLYQLLFEFLRLLGLFCDHSQTHPRQHRSLIFYHLQVLGLIWNLSFAVLPVDVPGLAEMNVCKLFDIDLMHFVSQFLVMDKLIKLWNWGKVEGIASVYGDVNIELLVRVKIATPSVA